MYKRQGLRNSPELDFTKEQIEQAIEKMGKGTSVRGETLSLEEFAKLSNLLGADLCNSAG